MPRDKCQTKAGHERRWLEHVSTLDARAYTNTRFTQSEDKWQSIVVVDVIRHGHVWKSMPEIAMSIRKIMLYIITSNFGVAYFQTSQWRLLSGLTGRSISKRPIFGAHI